MLSLSIPFSSVGMREAVAAVQLWSRRWDLNPHGVTRGILSPLRLPIPPLRDAPQSFLSVNIFSLVLSNAFSLSQMSLRFLSVLLQITYFTIGRKLMGLEPTRAI